MRKGALASPLALASGFLTLCTLALAAMAFKKMRYHRRAAVELGAGGVEAADDMVGGGREAARGGAAEPAMAGPPPVDEAKVAAAIDQLLDASVPIVLDQGRLYQDSLFSCGRSHVVRFRTYGEVGEVRGLHDVLPPHDIFMQTREGKAIFDTCAVVGNSGSLLETQFGNEIDGHAAVFRFNQGITTQYEQFVGSKTTFRIYNGPEVSPKEPGEIVIGTARSGNVMRGYVANKQQQAANATASSFVFDPEFLCYAWRFVGNGGHKLSSGLVGIILAVKLCKTVSVYGFQSQNYFSQTSRPHYYDWERPAKGREKVHPFQREYKLYEMLEASGRIRRVQAPRAAGEATR